MNEADHSLMASLRAISYHAAARLLDEVGVIASGISESVIDGNAGRA